MRLELLLTDKPVDIYEEAAVAVLNFAIELENNLTFGHEIKLNPAMPMYIKQVLAHRYMLIKQPANDDEDPLVALASSIAKLTGIPSDSLMELAKIPFKKVKV